MLENLVKSCMRDIVLNLCCGITGYCVYHSNAALVHFASRQNWQKTVTVDERVNLRLNPTKIHTKGFLTDFGRICHVH